MSEQVSTRPQMIVAAIKRANETSDAIKRGYAPCGDCGNNVVLGQYHLHKRSGDCKVA